MKNLKRVKYLLIIVFILSGCMKNIHVKTISEIKQTDKSQTKKSEKNRKKSRSQRVQKYRKQKLQMYQKIK